MGTLTFRTILGGIAGLVVWLLCEPFAPQAVNGTAWANWELIFISLLGLVIGAAVGGYNGYLQGTRTHFLRGLGLGALFGLLSIQLGERVGGAIFAAMTGGNAMTNIILLIPARFIALTLIGGSLGAGIGGASLNKVKFRQGVIGGLCGGAVGGICFDVVGQILGTLILMSKGIQAGSGEVGGPSRALYGILIGSGIALFIGLVERWSRSAWIRQNLGRNEGREWSLDLPDTLIGRNELAQIPLFGDSGVAAQHARIQQANGAFWLFDLGSPAGTALNGQPIPPQTAIPLAHGNVIRIGSQELIFLEKNQQAVRRAPEYGQPSLATPMQPAASTPMAPIQNVPMAPLSAPMQPVQMPTQVPAQPAAPLQATMMSVPRFVLVALDGPLLGQRFPVLNAMEVGREGSVLPLQFDTTVSRRHASLVPTAQGLQVSDLGSSNGTFLNGQRVPSGFLAPSQTLRIGITSFRVEES